jgi:hypothetical protein
MEYHYTYLLVSDTTPHLYIGARTSKVTPEMDPYLSSSSVVRKMRSEGVTFTKYVISEHSSRKDAIQEEINLHKTYQVDSDTIFLNKIIQPSTEFSTFPPRPTHPKLLERWLSTKRAAGSLGGKIGGKVVGAKNGKQSAHKLRKPKTEETKEKMRANANIMVSCLRCRLSTKLPNMNSKHFPKCYPNTKETK